MLGRRTAGVALVVCFAAVAGAVVRVDGDGVRMPLYPAWVAVLTAVGVLAGVALALSRRGGPAAAVALVVALQLAGTGVVARRHAVPAGGTGGLFAADVDRVRALAVVVVVAAAAAAVVSLLSLLPPTGTPVTGRRRLLATAAGLAVVVLVPLGIGATSTEMRDATSLGAMVLSYGLPWGAGLVAAGRLPRDRSVAAALTVAGSAALALVGPQMADLILGRPEPAFGAALLAAVVVLAAVGATRPARVPTA